MSLSVRLILFRISRMARRADSICPQKNPISQGYLGGFSLYGQGFLTAKHYNTIWLALPCNENPNVYSLLEGACMNARLIRIHTSPVRERRNGRNNQHHSSSSPSVAVVVASLTGGGVMSGTLPSIEPSQREPFLSLCAFRSAR